MINEIATPATQEEAPVIDFEFIQNSYSFADVNRLIQDAMADLLSNFSSQAEVEEHLNALYQWDADCAAFSNSENVEEIEEANSLISSIEDKESALQLSFFNSEVISNEITEELKVKPSSGDWIEVDSTAVSAFRLNSETSELDVQYKSSAEGLYYRYLDVPQDIFEELIFLKDTGGSVGSYLACKVKYDFEYDVKNIEAEYA